MNIINRCIFHRAHESWGLPEAPDYVAFAKKLQAAGYFHKPGLGPKEVLSMEMLGATHSKQEYIIK